MLEFVEQMGQEIISDKLGQGLGTQLFGDSFSQNQDISEHQPGNILDKEEDADESSDSEDDSDISKILAATNLEDSPWTASPAYLPTQYLSTVSEYLPPVAKGALPKGVRVDDAAGEVDKKDSNSWAFEGYENSLVLVALAAVDFGFRANGKIAEWKIIA